MILDIVTYPDPRLKEVCEPVGEVTDEIRQFAADMLETMYEAPGVGLAAPQVGRNIRMLVMDPTVQKEEKNPRVLINPVLTLSGEEVVSEQEGCLSVPMNYRADVKRMSKVHLSARDLDGNIIEEDLEEFPAIVIQHEFDHLDGVLFIDRISRLRRSLYDSKVKKWLKKKTAEWSLWARRILRPPALKSWRPGPAPIWWQCIRSQTVRQGAATSWPCRL